MASASDIVGLRRAVTKSNERYEILETRISGIEALLVHLVGGVEKANGVMAAAGLAPSSTSSGSASSSNAN